MLSTDKLSGLQSSLEDEKQSRRNALENKLRSLEQKTVQIQLSQEGKFKVRTFLSHRA